MKKILFVSIGLNIILLAYLGYDFFAGGGLQNVTFRFRGVPETAVFSVPARRDRAAHVESLELAPNGVVFLGDSLTGRGEWREMFSDHPRIFNRGVESDTSFGVLARLDPIIRSRPEKIFLMIGSNDCYFHRSGPSATIENHRKIIQRIREGSPGTTVYIQGVLPVSNAKYRDNAWIRSVNEGVARLADGRQVVYIDLHSAFKNENGELQSYFSSDGIHLNGMGYHLWRKIVTPFVVGPPSLEAEPSRKP